MVSVQVGPNDYIRERMGLAAALVEMLTLGKHITVRVHTQVGLLYDRMSLSRKTRYVEPYVTPDIGEENGQQANDLPLWAVEFLVEMPQFVDFESFAAANFSTDPLTQPPHS